MKRYFVLLFCLISLSTASLAEPVCFNGISFDSEAEYIDMGSQAVKDYESFIVFLRQFSSLKKVDMFETGIEGRDADELAAAFPGITFGWSLRMQQYHVVRSDAEVFSTLHDGIHPRHSSNDFSFMKYCTNLKALDLGHNNLTDISFLGEMPELRVLILADNPNLINIDQLASLENVEYLELFTCGIVDLSPLTALENLVDLNLCRNVVADWRPLKEMKNLRRLWVSNMCSPAMTPADRQELQDALPDTQIVFFDDPTDNGWRRDPITNAMHPHYETIYTMFKTGTYIPFADTDLSLPEEDGQ